MTEMTMMGIKITHNFFLFSSISLFSRLFELSHIRARTQFGWRGKSHFARLPKRMNVKRMADILKYSAYPMILPLSVCKLKLKFFGLARETNNEKKWLFTSLLLFFFSVCSKNALAERTERRGSKSKREKRRKVSENGVRQFGTRK